MEEASRFLPNRGEDTNRNLKHVKESQVSAVAVADLYQSKVLLAFSIARLALAKAGDMWFLLAASLSRSGCVTIKRC